MALPDNIGYGKVVGRFLLGYADGTDVDLYPDGVPAKGSIFFTPSPAYVKDATASPAPATILPAVVEARLNDDGYLCGPQTELFTDPGIRLVATDDAQLNPTNWTWRADFRLTDATGTPVPLNSFNFSLPEYKSPDNIVIDLTDALPVTPSNGTPTVVGPAGPANTLTVGTVESGSSPAVTITGTAPDQTINFTLEKGDKGDTGDTGDTGPKGDTGDTGTPGTPGADALWNFTGPWANGIDYAIGDVVEFSGSSYYAPETIYSSYSPPGNGWQLVSSKGDQGDEGPKGDTGDTGPAGEGLTILGTVATVGDLPATGNTEADAYIVTANGHLYIWALGEPDYWLDAGQIQGPAGEGVPTGGAANTFLVKSSSTDYDTEWSNEIDGGTA